MSTLKTLASWHQAENVPSNELNRAARQNGTTLHIREHVTGRTLHNRAVAKCVQPPGQTLQRTKTNVPGIYETGRELGNRLKNRGGK